MLQRRDELFGRIAQVTHPAAPVDGDVPRTRVPRRPSPTSQPSDCSSPYARATVLGAMPRSPASCRTVGSGEFGRRSPRSIPGPYLLDHLLIRRDFQIRIYDEIRRAHAATHRPAQRQDARRKRDDECGAHDRHRNVADGRVLGGGASVAPTRRTRRPARRQDSRPCARGRSERVRRRRIPRRDRLRPAASV